MEQTEKDGRGRVMALVLLYEVEDQTTIIFPDTGKQFQVLKVALICAVAVRLPRWEFLANKNARWTLRTSPAMAAGVTDRRWSVEDLVALWEAYEQAA
jgi:hypothetical protein